METFEVKLNAVSCRLNGKSNAHVYCKIVKLFKIAFEFPSVCKQKQLPEFSQNSRENICARVSFLIKLQASACNFVKRDTLAQVFFSEFCKISACNFIKKRPWHRCFPVNFAIFLRTPFLSEHFWWLLLCIRYI